MLFSCDIIVLKGVLKLDKKIKHKQCMLRTYQSEYSPEIEGIYELKQRLERGWIVKHVNQLGENILEYILDLEYIESEEIECEDEEMDLLFKKIKAFQRDNDKSEIEFIERQEKWFINSYKYMDESLPVLSVCEENGINLGTIYFSTEELARQAIDMYEEEYRRILQKRGEQSAR